jgi:hypothetical protein
VQAELAPGQHLEQLVERAGAAGQRHDGVGVHEHHLLALVHGLGDDDARPDRAPVPARRLAGDQVPRNHPEGGAARLGGGRGQRAHQPHVAGPVHQPQTGSGQRPTERAGFRDVGGVQAGARAAEDADGSPENGGHGGAPGPHSVCCAADL